MKIALDPYMFRHVPLLELPALVAELGYEYIELSPRPDFIPFFVHPRADKRRISEFRRALDDAGVEIATMLPLYHWAGPDEEERQNAVRYWKRAIEITVELGVDTMNSEFNGRPEQQPESEGQFWRSLEELLPIFEDGADRGEGAPRAVPPRAPRRRRAGLGGGLRLAVAADHLLGLLPDDGRGGADAGDADRDPQRQLHRRAAFRGLPDPLRAERPGGARVHRRHPPAEGARRRHGGRRGQAADRLRLPRADHELAGGRHADDRADRERAEGRARPLRDRDAGDRRGGEGDRAGARWTRRTIR